MENSEINYSMLISVLYCRLQGWSRVELKTGLNRKHMAQIESREYAPDGVAANSIISTAVSVLGDAEAERLMTAPIVQPSPPRQNLMQGRKVDKASKSPMDKESPLALHCQQAEIPAGATHHMPPNTEMGRGHYNRLTENQVDQLKRAAINYYKSKKTGRGKAIMIWRDSGWCSTGLANMPKGVFVL